MLSSIGYKLCILYMLKEWAKILHLNMNYAK